MIVKTIEDSVVSVIKDPRKLYEPINHYIVSDYALIEERSELKFKKFGDYKLVVLYGFSDVEEHIPAFYFPVTNQKNGWIAIDLRGYIKIDKFALTYEVRNEAEYKAAIQRLLLSAMWLEEQARPDLYTLKFAHTAYATWLSDNLSKRFSLDMTDQIKLKVVASIFYASLFVDEFTDEDYQKLKIRLKDDFVSSSVIDEVYEKTRGLYTDLNGLCKAMYAATGNIKLASLNQAVLLNLFSNSWYGPNGKYMGIIGLEFPPLWISLVYASLAIKSYRKMYIATLVEKINKRGRGDEFLSSYVMITKNLIENMPT